MFSHEQKKNVVMLLYEVDKDEVQPINKPTSDLIDCSKHFSLSKKVEIMVLHECNIRKHKEIGFRLLQNRSLAKRMTHFVSSANKKANQIQVAQYLKCNKKTLKCIFNDVENTNLLDYVKDKDITLDVVDGALFGNDATSYHYC